MNEWASNERKSSRLICRLSRHTYFAILCMISAVTSGGLIAGIGPFQTALVKENYFDNYNDVTSVFTGAFQIMTVLTCASGLILGPCGPRVTAMLGMLVAGTGNLLIGRARPGVSPVWVFIVGLGLVGGGGNALWLSFFPSTLIFKRDGSVATATATLSSMWNVAGLIYIILAIDAITVSRLFTASAAWNMFIFLLVFLILPDAPSTEHPKPRFEENVASDSCGGSLESNGAPNTVLIPEDHTPVTTMSPLTSSDTTGLEPTRPHTHKNGSDLADATTPDGLSVEEGQMDGQSNGADTWECNMSVDVDLGFRSPATLAGDAACALRWINFRFNKATIRCWGVHDTGSGVSEEQSATARQRGYEQRLDNRDSERGQGSSFSNNDGTENWGSILRDCRLWWWVAAFSACALFTEVLGGYIDVMAVAVGTKERDDDDFNGDDGNDEAVTTFTQVGYPVVSNMNVLFAPCFGRFVDKQILLGQGFSKPIALLLFATHCAAAACFLPDLIDIFVQVFSNDSSSAGNSLFQRQARLFSLYFVLAMLAAVQSMLYPLEFAYAEHRFEPRRLGGIIALETAMQALVGLIAYPGLSPNPFPGRDYRWPLLLAAAPAVFCWYSLWIEGKTSKASAKEQAVEVIGNGEAVAHTSNPQSTRHATCLLHQDM